MGFLAQKIVVIVVMFKIASTSSKNFDNETTQLVRTKRIIYGTPLTDSHSPFESPKFFANLYVGSGWSSFKLNLYTKLGIKFFSDTTPSPGGHYCGGSMLTPTIVGTAAHCVAHDVPLNETFNWCPRKNGWEDYYAVFVGYFTVRDVEANLIPGSYAWTTKYMIHENCGQVIHRPTNSSTITHDFAIAFLDREITFPKPGTHAVPAYSFYDIIKMFNYIQQRESICLFIGFGAYYWRAKGIKGDQSPIMLHGWRAVRNYRYCERRDGLGKDFMGFLGYDFTRVYTAVCHTFFGKFRSQTMGGDSGGPVTCDNIYVGLNSRGVSVNKPPDSGASESISWFSAIAFTLQWHSAQYRKNFLYHLKAFAEEPDRSRVLAHFHQQEAKPNGSSTFWFSSTAYAISIVFIVLFLST